MELDIALKKEEEKIKPTGEAIPPYYASSFTEIADGHFRGVQISWQGFEFKVVNIIFRLSKKKAFVKVEMNDGVPLKKVELEAIQRVLGMVLWESNNTFYHNITYHEWMIKAIEEVFNTKVIRFEEEEKL
ncbi:MAG: hypothetical protein QXL94_02200 [Candidatus Parvarchaeum sp.]